LIQLPTTSFGVNKRLVAVTMASLSIEVPLIVNPFSFLVFSFKTICDPRPFFFVCEDRMESKIEQQNVTTFIIKETNVFLLTTMMCLWHNEVLNGLA